MRTSTIRRIIVAVASFAAIVVIAAVAVVSRTSEDAPAQLRIREGKASITEGDSSPRLATEGENLESGDLIGTDNVGQAQIDLFDGSLVRLDASTQLELRKVARTENGRRITLRLASGRAWYRVDDATPGAFVSDLPGGRVDVTGTTFLGDCRQAPRCYLLGFEGEVEVTSGGAGAESAGPGDCLVVEEGEPVTECDEKKLGLVDAWVRDNLAEDQQAELRRTVPTLSPTASPTGSPDDGGRTRAPSRRAPLAPRPATPAPTVAETDPPTEEPSLTFPPRKTKRPRPIDPTPVPTPFDRTPKPTLVP